MKLTARLDAINSRRDVNGNTYWAFRFTDYLTGEVICGTTTGGESNISAIRHGFYGRDQWESSIEYTTTELPIRKFNKLTKDWPHAGCEPYDLQNFIRDRLLRKEIGQ